VKQRKSRAMKKRKTKPSLSAVVRDLRYQLADARLQLACANEKIREQGERLRGQLADARWQLARAKEKIREQGAQDEIDLAALDRCADAVTANERALFEASPAYQRYQEWRRTGSLVRKGDWRAP